jgi:hypothetical protein
MDVGEDPIELEQQDSEVLSAMMTEIESTSNTNTIPAPTVAAARQPTFSLYEEMIRYQEEHAEEAQSLIDGLQDNVESSELVRSMSVNSADDAKPAAYPKGVFRQPISRNYFSRKPLLDSSSHSDMLPSSPKSDTTPAKPLQNLEQGRPNRSPFEGTVDNEFILPTEFAAQTTAEIIKMLLESEKGESKSQHSDQDTDETLARQLHDVLNGSWSVSRRFHKQLNHEEMNLLSQISDTPSLTHDDDDELRNDRYRGQMRNFEEARKLTTSRSANNQSTAVIEENTQFQPPAIRRTNQQNLIRQREATLDVTLSFQPFGVDRGNQSDQSSFDADGRIPLNNDQSLGTRLHDNNFTGDQDFNTHEDNVSIVDSGRLFQSSQRNSNESYREGARISLIDETDEGDAALYYESRIPKIYAFAETSARGALHKSHALDKPANNGAADSSGSEGAGQLSPEDTELFTSWYSRTFSHFPIQVVSCQACCQRLQISSRYQLVRCPVCGTISPCGDTAPSSS